jgi:hypothetical protein
MVVEQRERGRLKQQLSLSHPLAAWDETREQAGSSKSVCTNNVDLSPRTFDRQIIGLEGLARIAIGWYDVSCNLCVSVCVCPPPRMPCQGSQKRVRDCTMTMIQGRTSTIKESSHWWLVCIERAPADTHLANLLLLYSNSSSAMIGEERQLVTDEPVEFEK